MGYNIWQRDIVFLKKQLRIMKYEVGNTNYKLRIRKTGKVVNKKEQVLKSKKIK